MQQCLPISLPKSKFESSAELAGEVDDDAASVSHGEGESEDSDPEVPSNSTQPLADQIHALNTRFNAYWDEIRKHRLALSQNMDALKAEMAIIRSH